ncbi:hypothetical protein PHLGIDRAFT_59691, partial [Phlebiopsis gigantea 11061_1 CR5-6]
INSVVTGLISKSEIGGPMACMYLLDHKDHYTSHEFRNLYWRSFVDYIHRPDIYGNMCLYDWTRLSEKIHSPKLRTQMADLEGRSGNEWDGTPNTPAVNTVNHLDNGAPDTCPPNVADGKRTEWHMFQPSHPQYGTSRVRMLPPRSAYVPNFIGGPLPRKDKGNREDYCMTMLTLFKPWRTGLDLKTDCGTWEESFMKHEFTDRHNDIMKYFHLRYECNDSRDEFSKARK